jgi:hypothetical protein
MTFIASGFRAVNTIPAGSLGGVITKLSSFPVTLSLPPGIHTSLGAENTPSGLETSFSARLISFNSSSTVDFQESLEIAPLRHPKTGVAPGLRYLG